MKRAVVDQPGLKYILIGLIVSLFLGLFLRSQIAPSKMYARMRDVANEIENKNEDQRLQIDFGLAEVQLSDWGIPNPSLKVSDIKISSRLGVCEDNQIYVESIRLPVSFFKIFSKNIFSSFRLGQVELRMHDIRSCIIKKNRSFAATNPDGSRPGPAGALPQALGGSGTRSVEISIDRLKIIDKDYFDQPLILQSLSAVLEIEKNDVTSGQLRSQVSLFREDEHFNYRLRSDLRLKYRKNDEGQGEMSAAFEGRLIDKLFTVKLDYDRTSDTVRVNHVFKNLSLKSLVWLSGSSSQRAGDLQKNIEAFTGLSFSSEGEGVYNHREGRFEHYELRDVLFSSDESVGRTPLVSITSFSPLEFRPFTLDFEHFDLSKLRGAPALAEINRSVLQYGLLTGQFHFQNGSLSANGVVEDTQFIFSNRGRRAVQRIDRLRFGYAEGKLNLDEIYLSSEKAVGGISLRLAKEKTLGSAEKSSFLRELSVRAQISQLKLSDDVYEIFFLGPQASAVISTNVLFENGALKANFGINHIDSEIYELKGVSASFSTHLFKAADKKFGIFVKSITASKTTPEINPAVQNTLAVIDPVAQNFKFNDVKLELLLSTGGTYKLDGHAQFSTDRSMRLRALSSRAEFTNFNDVLLLNKIRSDDGIDISNSLQVDLNRMVFQTGPVE